MGDSSEKRAVTSERRGQPRGVVREGKGLPNGVVVELEQGNGEEFHVLGHREDLTFRKLDEVHALDFLRVRNVTSQRELGVSERQQRGIEGRSSSRGNVGVLERGEKSVSASLRLRAHEPSHHESLVVRPPPLSEAVRDLPLVGLGIFDVNLHPSFSFGIVLLLLGRLAQAKREASLQPFDVGFARSEVVARTDRR